LQPGGKWTRGVGEGWENTKVIERKKRLYKWQGGCRKERTEKANAKGKIGQPWGRLCAHKNHVYGKPGGIRRKFWGGDGLAKTMGGNTQMITTEAEM